MDEGSLISWLIVVLLLFAAMYFAIAETAFASAPRPRLKARADKGDQRAVKALQVMDHIEEAITTILIGTNIVHIAAASIVTVNVTALWGVSVVAASTLITTLLVFFFGEMLPKSIARKYSETMALSLAPSLSVFMFLFRPLARILTMIGNGAASLTKGEGEASVTENELYDIIEDMTEEGTLNEEQKDLISSALQFGEVTVESILTSRMDLAAIDVSMKQEDVLELIRKQNHSRLPVYEGTIDNIIGILQIRKYIRKYVRERKPLNIRELLDEPLFVHQSTKIDDLLPLMSKKKLSMAVVTDNYGGTLGIVTVEDILEELVGEIWDEDDRVVRNIIPLGQDAYSVNAEEHVTDVLDEIGVDYDEEEEERLKDKLMSELAFENFVSIPKEGDSFRYLNTKITVTSMKKIRIYRLKVEKLPEGSDGKEEPAS